MIRVITSPWVRDALTDEDCRYLDAIRDEQTDATLQLLARHPGGPFVAHLYIPGREPIRLDAASLPDVFRALVAEVNAA